MWSQLLSKYNLRFCYFDGKDVALKSRHTASSELLGSFFTWSFFWWDGYLSKGWWWHQFQTLARLEWHLYSQDKHKKFTTSRVKWKILSTLEEIDSRAMKFNTSQASRAGGRAMNFMDSGRIIFSFVWILALFTFETSVSVKEQLIVTIPVWTVYFSLLPVYFAKNGMVWK